MNLDEIMEEFRKERIHTCDNCHATRKIKSGPVKLNQYAFAVVYDCGHGRVYTVKNYNVTRGDRI